MSRWVQKGSRTAIRAVASGYGRRRIPPSSSERGGGTAPVRGQPRGVGGHGGLRRDDGALDDRDARVPQSGRAPARQQRPPAGRGRRLAGAQRGLPAPRGSTGQDPHRYSAVDGQLGNWAGGNLLPGVRPSIPEEDLVYFALYSAQQPILPAERPSFDDMSLTREVDLSDFPDQMTQHPPLYYGLSAAVVKAMGADDWRFDRTLTLLRWVSVLLVAPLPLLAYSVAVRLSGRRRVGDLAAVLPLAIPQLGALGGAVTNDSLVVCLGGVLVLLLARMLTGDRSWRTTVGIGLVLGLGLLTKGTLLIAVPVVGLAL